MSYLSFPIYPKVKELQFKIMNDANDFAKVILKPLSTFSSQMFWSHLNNRISCVNIHVNLINKLSLECLKKIVCNTT